MCNMDRQTDRQTDGRAVGQTERQTDRQTDRQRKADGRTDKQTDTRIDIESQTGIVAVLKTSLLSQKQFDLAMELVGAEFEDRVHSYHKIWLPARDLVKTAVEKRHEVRYTLMYFEMHSSNTLDYITI